MPGTWEPGVEGVIGACKGEERLVDGKAADVDTQFKDERIPNAMTALFLQE